MQVYGVAPLWHFMCFFSSLGHINEAVHSFSEHLLRETWGERKIQLHVYRTYLKGLTSWQCLALCMVSCECFLKARSQLFTLHYDRRKKLHNLSIWSESQKLAKNHIYNTFHRIVNCTPCKAMDLCGFFHASEDFGVMNKLDHNHLLNIWTTIHGT